MNLAQQMFAIAPAYGRVALGSDQEALLVGKAAALYRASVAGVPVIPSIVITREAWEGLLAERRNGADRLLMHWVATLFRLVGRGETPPHLVVRTSAPAHAFGLMPARDGIPAPKVPSESIDLSRPLASAIADAFASYPTADDAEAQARQIVLVQSVAQAPLRTFLSRDPQTGALGPAAADGRGLAELPAEAGEIATEVDGLFGAHMLCLAEVRGARVRLVSLRPATSASAGAELEAAVDRVTRGTWSEAEAVARISPAQLVQMLHPRLRADNTAEPVAVGLGVSPGAASGTIVFTPEDAARLRARGRHCILVVTETGPADIEGMKAATGILTARGGMTSHAGVVARITGKPCVAGVRTLSIDLGDLSCRIGERVFRAGDRLTIDGSDGNVYAGPLPLSRPHIGGAIGQLLHWSDASRTIAVRTNVETVEAARTALSFGAEGIGLARSEHMFFSPERMVALRRLILSEDENDRAAALSGLIEYQTGDYAALFAAMQGKPVTVRLFDPPLHEFLPRSDEEIEETARSLGLETRTLRHRLERLAEVNPMLGHRGVRLAITYPEILEMQMQALVAGVQRAAAEQNTKVQAEVMVPFVSTRSEVQFIRERVFDVAERSGLLRDERATFSFGTMIELPRAALRAGEIAREVDFFSFGTNDLTQTTFGISRDDAPAFLAAYQRKGLYDHDPFVTIDQRGVGEMIAIAIERGKAANPGLKIGICGEHAGDPASLAFFATLGIDYVSCAPYRVPVARLALAQAGL